MRVGGRRGMRAIGRAEALSRLSVPRQARGRSPASTGLPVTSVHLPAQSALIRRGPVAEDSRVSSREPGITMTLRHDTSPPRDKMEPVLRAILFDFNGVLVDDEPLHLELFQKVLAEEGVQLSEEDYYRRYLALDDRGCFSQALLDSGDEPEAGRLARLIARKASYYRDRIRRDGYPFFPGALELVREAAAAEELMLGVVSGALREEVQGALRQAEVRDAFKVVVAAEDVKKSKPDPEGYIKGLEGLNSRPPLPGRLIHPHEVLAIEDSPGGLAAAAAAGLSTLAVAQTYPLDQLDAAQAVETLAGLTLAELRKRFEQSS